MQEVGRALSDITDNRSRNRRKQLRSLAFWHFGVSQQVAQRVTAAGNKVAVDVRELTR